MRLHAEPEKEVMSRSGDECVVALTDQWYLDYGEPAWKEQTLECLNEIDTFAEDTKKKFFVTMDWLKEWGCSRSFGLGTQLPWDPQYVIESLSDSTVYMAFYTVVHLLQGGVLDGSSSGPLNITAESLTDEVWDFIFLNQAYPEGCGIDVAALDRLRREFNYWYPVDVRTSGKDLINNHLTFFMYNHTALFPKEKWPRGIRTNGHLLLNNNKMSKSAGNFITLRDAVSKYSADALRFGLAISGDSNEDANLEEDNTNAMVLRLYSELQWIEGVIAQPDSDFVDGPLTRTVDRMFDNNIRKYMAE